ncbi:hypothetical protein [Methylobacterium tardum]|uniref:Uncharacterized protein n=1 Tax=Methylobacterium tardum TaxID=374432 RepID=A0AA37TAR3_9HYPH|nr:hypothetical protein [Methylobacterium tardum]URD38173.1 hypothetical protein M6G65_06830 [Methylobacterium tardum]GLS69959.1 hypothetical protein GCM10007890_19720 [Methylobacterium tardum]
MFNREYRAIWQRTPKGTVREADPHEWMPFKTPIFYSQDDSRPWLDRRTHRFREGVLASWSLPERAAPYGEID